MALRLNFYVKITCLCLLLMVFPLSYATAKINHCGVYGHTKDTDHLWRIAIKVRPNQSVSLQQIMLALLKRNPHAFSRHNINNLMSGYFLHLPCLVKIKSIPKAKALKIVARQNAVWNGRQVSGKKQFVKHSRKSNRHKLTSRRAKQLAIMENVQKSTTEKITTIQKNLVVIQQNAQNFQKQTNQQIATLTTQNNVLQDQLTNVNDKLTQVGSKVSSIEQKTTQLQTTQANLEKNLKNDFTSVSSYVHRLQRNLGYVGVLGLIVAILLVLLLLLKIIYLSCGKKTKSAPTNKEVLLAKEESESKSEVSNKVSKASPAAADYDFLEGKEGVAVKLDLAHVYLDMDDKANAETILKEVVEKGDAKQKAEAQSLLAAFKDTSKTKPRASRQRKSKSGKNKKQEKL